MRTYRKDGTIFIEIDEQALIDAGGQHPETPYRVTDRELFLNHVVEELLDIGDNGDNHSCSDLTRLIDRCTEDAVMCSNGAEIVEASDDED
jgi:hypothetical protein